jgi:hypothetical protein
MSLSNRPAPLTAQEVTEWLADSSAALTARRDEILAGYQRFSANFPDGIDSEETQKRAVDFAGARGIMGVYLKECETARTLEKKPFLDGGRAVERFYKDRLMDPVEACQRDVRGKIAAYEAVLQARRMEAARLEAERLAAEAREAEEAAIESMSEADLQRAMEVQAEAEQAAVIADSKPAATRGDLGTVVSLRTRLVADYEASDLMALVRAVAAGKAPLAYLAFNTTRINYAIRSEKARDIPGVVIKEERTVV